MISFLRSQAEGYDKVNFARKDLYNRMDREKQKEILNGDAKGALAHLEGKKNIGNNFVHEYNVNSEGRLNRLFWVDLQTLLDYKYFGDVLVFDSTYNTSQYFKPLVVLYGVNNHFSTVIFACYLVSAKDEESFDWVL
ncbi:hypothetical protein ACH5RR_036684 [Cinchona calisaya]|uniref:MULE transposase domain-containing protein n=1 Tax=Cinchona calisaya TaxID=153742 RepID=A0ABD2Y5N5_9GENT